MSAKLTLLIVSTVQVTVAERYNKRKRNMVKNVIKVDHRSIWGTPKSPYNTFVDISREFSNFSFFVEFVEFIGYFLIMKLSRNLKTVENKRKIESIYY